jgi:hypothetical protein
MDRKFDFMARRCDAQRSLSASTDAGEIFSPTAQNVGTHCCSFLRICEQLNLVQHIAETMQNFEIW